MVSGDHGLTVTDARVRFGPVTAVDGVDLQVHPGEITALVGPSGCGKSSLLRFVAGLETGAGTVRWDGIDLTRLRPDRRRFGLMFQDHALFTNRSVAGNIAFGLEMAGFDRRRRTDRTAEMLALVGLDGYETRPIDTLSGGEAQRVALARALAPAPRLLMLDEPLGSLDRELRERLAGDLRRILTTAGVAAVLVTHDQEEAYAVADQLAVMRAGRIVRNGAVGDVWADPATLFTARFLGHRNIVTPERLETFGLEPFHTDAAAVVVREAAIDIGPADDPHGRTALIDAVRFRGAISQVDLAIDDLILQIHTPRPPRVGSIVTIRIDPDEIVPLHAD